MSLRLLFFYPKLKSDLYILCSLKARDLREQTHPTTEVYGEISLWLFSFVPDTKHRHDSCKNISRTTIFRSFLKRT